MADNFSSVFTLWEEIALDGLGYELGSAATIRVTIPKRLRHEWDATWNVEAANDEERQRLGDEQRYQLIGHLAPKVVLVRNGEEVVFDLTNPDEARRLDQEEDGQVLTLVLRELWQRAADKVAIAQAKWRGERLAVLQPAQAS